MSGFLCRGSVCDAAEIKDSVFPFVEQRSLAHLPHLQVLVLYVQVPRSSVVLQHQRGETHTSTENRKLSGVIYVAIKGSKVNSEINQTSGSEAALAQGLLKYKRLHV